MKKIIFGILMLIITIQFIRPDMSNAPEDASKNIRAHVKVPDEISNILNRSCGDCHSNTTQWPWYSKIAPASWVIADDVLLGRQHLNFSEWGTYSKKKMGKKLYLISEVAADKSMPLTLYVLAHQEAELSQDERKMLAKWADEQADQLVNEDHVEKDVQQ